MAAQRLVIDASAFISAFIQDRRNEVQEAILAFQLYAPGNFETEISAMLLREQRAGNVDGAEMTLMLNAIEAIDIETYAPRLSLIIETAHKHSLTAYDAAYLAASIEMGSSIATTDKALAAAARSEGRLWSFSSSREVSFLLEPLLS